VNWISFRRRSDQNRWVPPNLAFIIAHCSMHI